MTPTWPTLVPRHDVAVLADPHVTLPIARILRAAGMTVATATVPAASGDPYREAIAAVDSAPLIVSIWSNPTVDRATSTLVASRLAESAPSACWFRISQFHLAPPVLQTVHIPLTESNTFGIEAHNALEKLARGNHARQMPAATQVAQHILNFSIPSARRRGKGHEYPSREPGACFSSCGTSDSA